MFQAAPDAAEVDHGSAAVGACDGAAEEHLGAKARGAAIGLARPGRGLPKREQVEEHEHGTEHRLGGVKLAAAKVVGPQIAFEFVDALLEGGALVVVAPDQLGGLVTVGHKEGVGVAGTSMSLRPTAARPSRTRSRMTTKRRLNDQPASCSENSPAL